MEVTPLGPRAWRTLEGGFLAGFSHGAAGIAYSLGKLYDCSGIDQFREAAREGLEYERLLYVPEEANWPDLSISEVKPVYSNKWCHGAVGIGFGRLGTLAISGFEGQTRTVELAVQLTLSQDLAGVDHLCCGNAGQISFLAEAARRLERPEWEKGARQRLAGLLARRNRLGAFRLFEALPLQAYNPGFMQGEAGIGYEWLRLSRPDLALPSVLLLE